QQYCIQISMIRYWGYPAESYDVTTEDGYILNMIRIPSGRFGTVAEINSTGCGRTPILLMHGLFCDAATFVLNPHDSSPAMFLADMGFDVFLPSSRGTTNSQRHVNLTTSDAQFWKFTQDDMARYDTPAFIDKILELNGAEALYYVGHSQGTTIGFMALAERPEYNKKVRAMFQLAPAGPNYERKGLLRLLFGAQQLLMPVVNAYKRILGSHEFGLHVPGLLSNIARTVCPPFFSVCRDVMFLAIGPPSAAFNLVRNILLIIDILFIIGIRRRRKLASQGARNAIEHFDISPSENLRRYGEIVALPYNYKLVDTDVYLFWSRNDWLTTPDNIK
ncbi:hypothetical protein PFISCL1PPCAC_14380, partial [Pristionchus fissidentatus]